MPNQRNSNLNMMAASWQKNLAKIIMQICFHISGICSARLHWRRKRSWRAKKDEICESRHGRGKLSWQRQHLLIWQKYAQNVAAGWNGGGRGDVGGVVGAAQWHCRKLLPRNWQPNLNKTLVNICQETEANECDSIWVTKMLFQISANTCIIC